MDIEKGFQQRPQDLFLCLLIRLLSSRLSLPERLECLAELLQRQPRLFLLGPGRFRLQIHFLPQRNGLSEQGVEIEGFRRLCRFLTSRRNGG